MENFLDIVAELEFDSGYNLNLELKGYEVKDSKESPHYKVMKDMNFIGEKLEDVEKLGLDDAIKVAHLILEHEKELRNV